MKKNIIPYPNKPNINPYGQTEIYREGGIK